MPDIKRTDQFVTITGIDDHLKVFPDAVKIKRIEFVSGIAKDNVIVIKQGSEDGATICTLAARKNQNADRIDFGDGCRCKPFVDFKESTLTILHKLNLELA